MSPAAELMQVAVPDIGDFSDVPIIEILVAPGDTVAAEDALVTLESDKATMDVPSPAAGTVRELLVSVGERVSQGTALLALEPATPAAAAAAAAAAEPPPGPQIVGDPDVTLQTAADAAEVAEPAEMPRPSTNGHEVYASPSVRRLGRELGINLSAVAGTGRKGRITLEDVRGAGESGGAPPAGPAGPPAERGDLGFDLAPWPTVDFARFGEIERVERSRIQRISGPALARNWVRIPHVTQFDEADITELEAWRKELNAGAGSEGVRLTMLSFLIAACVSTLKAFPTFNASLDGEDLVLRRYYNIGFAADTPGGLVVPVIRDADQRGLLEIAGELQALSAKAREGRLTPAEMAGGTFTISSLGGIGGTAFTPIINAPEVAILGVSRSAMRPVWDSEAGAFIPRLMLPLSLSYDHRVIDGATAARFTVHLSGVLADLRRVLL